MARAAAAGSSGDPESDSFADSVQKVLRRKTATEKSIIANMRAMVGSSTNAASNAAKPCGWSGNYSELLGRLSLGLIAAIRRSSGSTTRFSKARRA